MSNYQLDRIDQKILSFLVKNARMPFLEIARECGVSGAAIHQRVKRLEANGVITGSRLLVKPQALGLNVCAFVSVSLSEANKYPEVIESFKRISEIVECSYLLDGICTLAESIAENSFVFGADFIDGLVEKLVIEIVNEIFFDECLQSEEYKVVVVNTRHTRSHVGNELCYLRWELCLMRLFVKI